MHPNNIKRRMPSNTGSAGKVVAVLCRLVGYFAQRWQKHPTTIPESEDLTPHQAGGEELVDAGGLRGTRLRNGTVVTHRQVDVHKATAELVTSEQTLG